MACSSMRQTILAAAMAALCFLAVVAQSAPSRATAPPQSERFDGHEVLRVIPKNQRQMAILTALQDPDVYHVDFWKQPAKNRPVDIHIAPDELQKVKQLFQEHGVEYEILISNLQSVIDAEEPVRSKRSAPNFLESYHSHQEINEWLEATAAKCGRRCSIINIGQSHEGREMKVIKVNGLSESQSKPAIWIDAGIHAREWVAPVMALNIVNKLVTEYLTSSCTRYIADQFTWYILPAANPDGYDYSRTRNRMWRKNRKPATAAATQSRWATYFFNSTWPAGRNCWGIDPNRNFAFRWGGLGSSSNPCADTYGGPQAFSEPETLNMRRFLSSIQQTLRVYVSLHSYGQYWLYSWGYSKRLPADHQALHSIAYTGAAAIRNASDRHQTVYTVGSAARALYPASGGADDWAKGELGVKYAFTIELPPGDNDDGIINGFILPERELPRVTNETWPGIQAMANSVLQSLDPSRRQSPARDNCSQFR